jgi:RNA polymerase sigma factor (sigma-70 family)
LNQENHISNHEEVNFHLWQLFKAGDADALGKLAQIHYRVLYHYGSKFSTDTDFVRDCIQELYLELWERRSFLSETPFVKSYLLKALRHRLIKESKRLRRFQEPQLLEFDSDENEHPVEESIIENENATSVLKKLNQIISQLSKRQQEVIYLRFYQNLENDDISHIMGLGKQSVANLLYRTIKEIKGIWIPAEFIWLLLIPNFI